jgi:hypothetical protein
MHLNWCSDAYSEYQRSWGHLLASSRATCTLSCHLTHGLSSAGSHSPLRQRKGQFLADRHFGKHIEVPCHEHGLGQGAAEDCNWEGQELIKMRICSSAGAVENGWLLRSGAGDGGRQAPEQSEERVEVRLEVIPDSTRRGVLTGARHQPPGSRASEFAHAGLFGDTVNGAEASPARRSGRCRARGRWWSVSGTVGGERQACKKAAAMAEGSKLASSTAGQGF